MAAISRDCLVAEQGPYPSKLPFWHTKTFVNS